jgi:hypothetical protein
MGWNLSDCRSVMGEATDRNTSPPEEMDEERLITLYSEKQKQKTEELTKTQQCAGCATMDKNINKSVDDVSVVQSKLEDVNEASTRREESEVNLQNHAHTNKEMKQLREKLNEDNVMKTEIKELKSKVEFLMQLNRNQMMKYEEAEKRLEDSVHRISTENKKLREEIDWIRECHKDDMKAAKMKEAVGDFSAAGVWKISDKQVSHSLAFCRESGEFKT